MGLDLDAILTRATRLQATYVVAAVATVLVFAGHFVWNAQDAVTSFVLVLTAIGTPWAVITLTGFRRCRGEYDRESLQVLNKRSHGGRYWYRAGWNVPATVAWAAGSLVGLCAVDTPVYRGPLLSWTGGIDVSFVLSGAVAWALYALLSRHSETRGGRSRTRPRRAAARCRRPPRQPRRRPGPSARRPGRRAEPAGAGWWPSPSHRPPPGARHPAPPQRPTSRARKSSTVSRRISSRARPPSTATTAGRPTRL
jgi:hypothetical protein